VKRTKAVDREVLYLGRHPEFLRIISEARARFATGRKLSLDEVKRAVLPKRAPKASSKRPTARKARSRARP